MLHYTPQFSGRNDKNNFAVIHLRWINFGHGIKAYMYTVHSFPFHQFSLKKVYLIHWFFHLDYMFLCV